MGILNLIAGNWVGKVGQLVGATWMGIPTLRSYAIPGNPRTQDQRKVRSVFGDITSFTSLFTDQIKYLSSMPTKHMTVRNAIVQANRDQLNSGTFNKDTMLVNKGGLPNVQSFTASYAGGAVSASWDEPVATNITDRALCVMVVVDKDNKISAVGSNKVSAKSMSLTVDLVSGTTPDVYYWLIDYRGSTRAGSNSAHTTITV